jgi:hypothetical protein
MPCGKIIYCAMFHNFGPSLTIIMDDGDQYFKKKKVQNVHNATCQFLINGWQLMMLAWNHMCNYN